MLERVRRLGAWLDRRRERASLDRPLTYGGVAAWLWWRGLPAMSGPLVVLAWQVLANGRLGLVVFGGGAVMFAIAAAGAVAFLRDSSAAVGAAAVGWLAVTGGAGWWTLTAGYDGVAAWLVGFLGFTSLVGGAATYVGVQNELRDE